MADKDKDLTHLFVRDLDDIPLPSRDRWRPAPRKDSPLMKSSRYVLYAGAIAAVLVVALIASFQLRGSNLVAASPSPSGSMSPVPSASPTPAATPIGFVLPADCSYVSGPLPVIPAGASPSTYWEFTCAGAATPDLKAVERIAPAFAAQGWTPCPSNPGTGVWWKGTTQTMVAQGTRPGLSQLARQTQDCPDAVSTGAITGTFSYESDFIPPLTVYAITVNDPKIFFAVDFAGVGNPPRPTLPPGVSQPMYTLSGIAPGTYYVIAYRNDGFNSLGVAGYSQYTVKCIQATTGGQNSTPAPGCTSPGDHSLIPVTVRAGETVSRIDIKDWNPSPPSSYPARPAGSAPVDQCGVIDEAFLGDPPSGGYVTISGVKYLVQGADPSRSVTLTGRLVPGATACARGTGIRISPGVIDMRTGSVTAAP